MQVQIGPDRQAFVAPESNANAPNRIGRTAPVAAIQALLTIYSDFRPENRFAVKVRQNSGQQYPGTKDTPAHLPPTHPHDKPHATA